MAWVRCRHTVPDWHRYAGFSGEEPAIFAACRLLVREGEARREPRSIACGYWGRQDECPLFEGPGGLARPGTIGTGRPTLADVPVEVESIWPVRPPIARDGMRIVLAALGVLSIVLLLWTIVAGFSVMRGTAAPASFGILVLAAAAVSIVTHALATLRVWARG